jgi:hypothetical protein
MIAGCGAWLLVVTGSSLAIVVLSLGYSASPRVCWCCLNVLLFMMRYDTVAMIKQSPERYDGNSLAIHGDVVYIACRGCVIQWNLATDLVVKHEGYTSLHFTPLSLCFLFMIVLDEDIYALDVSSDGSVMVSGNRSDAIAHNTATGAVLWRKYVSGRIRTLCIHGGVVVVPVDNSNTEVLDVTTGHIVHILPSAGENIKGICVFDGLALKWRSFFVLHVLI